MKIQSCLIPTQLSSLIVTPYSIRFELINNNNIPKKKINIIIVNDKGEKIKEILLGAVLMITINCENCKLFQFHQLI
jgi:hypothetical protein